MWKPIEIKPNDQSVVGKTVRPSGYSEIIITHVGATALMGHYPKNVMDEYCFPISMNFKQEIPDEEVKETKLVSPCVVEDGNIDNPFYLTETLYSKCRENTRSMKHQWPARVVLKNVVRTVHNANFDNRTEDIEGELWFVVK